MDGMYRAILKKLQDEHIEVQETNTGLKNLPNPTAVTHNEIWFCGHSRFVEINRSVGEFGAFYCPGGATGWSDLTVKVTLLSQYLGDTPGLDLAWGASE